LSGELSVQSPQWISVLSSNKDLTNFKYIFDIYDVNGEQLVRAKIYPNVKDGYGYFDVSSVIRNEVNFQWLNVDPGNYMKLHSCDPNNNEQEIPYSIFVGEEYNVGASGIMNVGLASGGTTAYNFTYNPFNRTSNPISELYGDYFTNRPRNGYTAWGERFFVGFYYSGTVPIEIKKYDCNNALVSTTTFNKNLSSKNFHQLDIGMETLNNESGTSIFSDADTCGYYTVKINGKIFRIDIKCDGNHTPINLHFMSGLGMYDTARFDCVSKLNMAATRKSYGRNDVSFASGQVTYISPDNIYNETKINYSQSIDWTYKLMMNFPTDAEWEFLSELIYSPHILMEIDGFFYPVTIKNTSYEYFKQIYAKLKTFEIEVEVNQKRTGFRR
jgi:hypothetical protein